MAGEGTNVGRIHVTIGLKNEMGQGVSNATSDLKKLENTANSVGKNVENSLGNSLKSVSTQSASLSSTISNNLSKAFSGISSRITSSLSSAKASILSFSSAGVSAFNNLTSAGEKAYNRMGFFGTAMAAIFTYKLKNAIQEATSVFMTFDDQMRKVQAVTESTGAQFDELTEQARLLGATTSFTAQEAAEAMTLLGQAGFDANEVIAAMPATLNLARASMTELSTTADIMSNIMNGFRLGADETERASDVLSKAANATNTNVTELGNAMKYVAPLAYQMGWSLEETASAAGLLSNAGIKSSMAGTVLRNSISRLLSPTQKATDTLSSYGITIDSVSPKTHSFAEIIDTLSTSGITAGDVMQVFGMRAGPGILAMMNIGTGAITDMNQALMDSAGYAQAAADKMDAGWGGAVRRLNDMVESLQISFGNAFANILTPIIKVISAIGVAISKLPSPILTLAAAFALVAVAAGTLLVSLAALPVIAGVLSAGFETAGIAITFIAETISGIAGTTLAADLAFEALSMSVAGIVAAVAEATIVFAAVGIVLYELEKKTQIFSKTWETLKDLWTIGTYYAGKAFEGLKEIVSDAIDDIMQSIKKLSEDTGIGKFIDGISKAYDTISETLGKWRADTHETAEAIRDEESKQAESTQNVQNQIERAHEGIVASYQTVDEETGQTYASMIESATDGADGVVSANDDIISSNDNLISSNNSVAESFSYKMKDTDISSIVSQNYGMDDFNEGIKLADGGFVKLNEKGQLVYQTVDGISKILSELPSMSLETEDGGVIQTKTDVPVTKSTGRVIKVGEEGKKRNAEDEAYLNSSEYTESVWASEHSDYTSVDLSKYPGYTEEQIERIESGEWDKPIVIPDKSRSTAGMSNYDRNVAIARENKLTPEQAGTIPDSYKTKLDPKYIEELNDKGIIERLNEKYNNFVGSAKTSLTDDTGISGFFKSIFSGNIGTALGGESPKEGGTFSKIWEKLNAKVPGTENVMSASFDISGAIGSFDKLKEKMGEVDSFSFSSLLDSISNISSEQDTASGKAESHRGILESLGGTSLSGIWDQISNIGSEQDTAKGKGEEHKGILDTLGSVSFSGLVGQILGIGSEQDTAKEKGDDHRGVLDTLNSTSMGGIIAQILGIGSEEDIAKGKGEEHKGTLDIINSTSMGSIIAQIFGVGSEEDTTTSKGGLLKYALDTVNSTSMGSIIAQIFGVGSEENETSGKTVSLTSLLRIAGGVSFSGTINQIKSVISTINDAISAAGSLISKLYEAAKAKVSDFVSGSSSTKSSSVYGYTASEEATRKANRNVYNNNVVYKNTINNNGDKLSASKARAAGV